jgi:1-acyl-sn-glycerol-3-phosphate acyltransferase
MNFVYGAGSFLSRVYFDLFFPGEVGGTEFIPRSGPFLLAANHASYFDPPAIGCRLPRESHYFARKTLFKPGLKETLLRKVNTIPVDLESDSDISALKAVFRVLKEGGGILLFPEGTRTHDGGFQPARPGVGMIACKSGVPVVPTRIFGSYEAFGRQTRGPKLFTPIHIAYAPPLLPAQYDTGGKGKERYQVASETIMRAIATIPPPPAVQV